MEEKSRGVKRLATAPALGVRPSSAIIFAVGPFTARPPMIGDTAITGAAQSASPARTPGTARIGSMLMNGLDGQITTALSRESASAARKSGCASAASAP